MLVTPKRSVVALEEAHYPPLRQVFRAAGARIVTAPVDLEGIIVDRISPQARIVCVMPSHQLPPVAASAVLSRAAEAGIKVQAVSEFSIGKASLNGVAFGYGGIADGDVDAGVRLLANVIVRAGKRR